MAGARPKGPLATSKDDEVDIDLQEDQQTSRSSSKRVSLDDELLFGEKEEHYSRHQAASDDEDDEDDELDSHVRSSQPTSSTSQSQAIPSLNDPDSPIFTPFGSPMSDISDITSIRKWTGEVKKMLLEDQRSTENRAKSEKRTDIEFLSVWSPMKDSFDKTESALDLEDFDTGGGGTSGSEQDFSVVLPTHAELAEKYSEELVLKERLLLQKEAKIIELEKSQRDLSRSLEDCEKELKQKINSEVASLEKLKISLEEKDKSIMETSERLRQVTESYNSSEQRWKEQETFLEKQIGKLKDELEEEKVGVRDELVELRKEKKRLENELETMKEENGRLKRGMDEQKEELERELEVLREEKEGLKEEIEELKDRLMVSEREVEMEKEEKESLKEELEEKEERNKVLEKDNEELKGRGVEAVGVLEKEKERLEEELQRLKEEMDQVEDEKVQWEVDMQLLRDQLEDLEREKKEQEEKAERLRKEEIEELERKKEEQLEELKRKQEEQVEELRRKQQEQVEELERRQKEQLEEIQKRKEEEVEQSSAPLNFFTGDEEQAAPTSLLFGVPPPLEDEDWLEQKKELQDRIAELELDKGNLLLRLVDVDDSDEDKQQGKEEEIKEDINAVKLKESEEKMEQMEEELTASQDKIIFLERELEELKRSESERIEIALTTIAWEEKLELLQKENQQLSDELLSHRKGADELSTRYEALEQKYLELEETSIKQAESASATAAAAAEALALVEIDKCDGWSDDTPQIPDADEGFTEDPLIAELKEQLDEKDREISLLSEKHIKLEEIIQRSNEQMQNYEENLTKMNEERKLNTDKLNEVLQELENVRQQMIEKEIEQQEQTQAQLAAAAAATLPVSDGWGDDIPVLLDDPSTPSASAAEAAATQQKLEELEQSLTKTRDEFTAVTTKCHSLEEKLKKAMKVIKQRNEKIAEYKNRLGDDPMNTSMMETSLIQVVQEAPMVQVKAVGVDLGAAPPQLSPQPTSAPLSPALREEAEKLKRELDEKEYRIRELESFVQLLQEREAQVMAAAQAQAAAGGEQDQFILQQKDMEISALRNEMSQLVATLNNKNEEVESLMRACGDMQRSLDDKVELLNDSVTKKDEEVREAISQYEECLKNTTLNVSQLTQELEEKIRMINQLQASLQEAQEALIETQNQFEASKAREAQQSEVEKESLVLQLQGLREEYERVNTQLGELQVEHGGVREALERAEQEKARMREDANCIQNEYGAKNGELQLKISNLMDQLNDCESAVSVMEARVKEADEKEQEWRAVVEDKGKALEQVEQQLFVKNEEVVRLEERLRGEELRGGQVEQLTIQLNQLNESYNVLQAQYAGLHQEYTRISEEYSQKCMQIQEQEVAGGAEVVALRGTVQTLEQTLQSYVEALNNANVDIVGKQAELGNLQGVIAQYEEKMYNGALELEEEKRKVEEGRNKLKLVEEEAIKKEVEVDEVKGEIEALRKEVEERKEKEERNRAEVATLKEETGRLSQENGRLNQLVIRYQNVEESLNKYLEDLNGATEELGRKNNEVRELQEALKEGENQVQRMRERMEGLAQDVASREQMLQDKNEEVARLQVELRKVREEGDENSSKYTKELLQEVEEKGREISDLRFELDEGIVLERNLKKVITEKDMEIEALRNEISSKEGEIDRLKSESIPVLSPEEQSLQQKVIMMERKVDLLQGKLAEVEESEVKCYEDFSRLKILRTELEMDNLRMSGELEQLRRSLQDGDNDPKYKSMENQLILMSKTLEDRDKLCRDLMKNVSELQEQKDALQKAFPPEATLYQEYQVGNEEDTLENRVLQQDREIFSLRIDLEREKKIRELYEGQLFLATSKKQFETERERKSTSSMGGGGGWFGLSELFSPSPPSPPRRLSPRPSTPHLMPPQSQSHGFGTPSSSMQGRQGVMMPPQQLPMTPSTPFNPALFEMSPSSSSPGNVFLPQVLQPNFEAAASGDQSVSLPPASLFMERDPQNSL